MDIRAAAEAALAQSLETSGVPVTFTDPTTANTQTVTGSVSRADEIVDPQTGARVYAPHTEVTVRLSSLSPVPDDGWPVQTTDVSGATIDGVCRDLVYDRTHGVLRFYREEAE
jgi:hypothetical protein